MIFIFSISRCIDLHDVFHLLIYNEMKRSYSSCYNCEYFAACPLRILVFYVVNFDKFCMTINQRENFRTV